MIFRLSILVCFTALLLVGQTKTLTVRSSAAAARPGDVVTLSLSISADGTAALQWRLMLPSGITAPNPTIAPALAVPSISKQLDCFTSSSVCMLWGMNVNVIPAGDVATYTATIAQTANPGNLTLNVSSTLASDPLGSAVAIAAGPDVVLRVLAREDLNGDGAIDMTDAIDARDQGLGAKPCGSGDVNRDGKCDVIDVIQIVLKSMPPP